MADKYLVLKASGGGGLGDSIKALLVAATYASLSNRVLVVDWNGGVYQQGDNNALDHLFRLTNLRTQKALPEPSSIYPESWFGRLSKSLHEVYTLDGWETWQRAKVIDRYSFDLSKLDYTYDVLVMWEFDQVGKLSEHITGAESSNGVYSYACKQFLRYSDSFQKALEQNLARFNSLTVGVHVRSTKEFAENKGQLALNHYIKTVDRALKKSNQKALFLATDNQEVQRLFEERYPSVYSLDKWFAEAGEPLHLNKQCPNQLSNASDALMDIVMLSYCPSIVITPYSSFSEMAEIFAKARDNNVVILNPKPVRVLSKMKRLFKLKQLFSI